MGMTPASDPLPWRIEVEIDELVLNGFERVDRDAVSDAFRRELDRLLRRDPSRLASAGARSDNDTERARVAADLPAIVPSHRLGQSLAGAVFRAIDGVNERAAGPR
jgi:hypothetical protein